MKQIHGRGIIGWPLLIAAAGLMLGFVGIVHPPLFLIALLLGATFVQGVIALELYDAFRSRRRRQE
jgi:hypothetical protein